MHKHIIFFNLTLEINIVLEELRNQNKSVYNNVFNHFYRGMVLYANNFLYDKDASEDIVQEVFISLWENSGDIEIKSSLKAYLYAMVRNKCLNYLKSIKITDDINLIDLNSILVWEEDFEMISEEEKRILYTQILKIIETFPESMQEIFKLKFVENYKYIEIAEKLDISVNTVKTQLKRAKQKINQAIPLLLSLFSPLL